MQVSEDFAKVVRATLISFALMVIGFAVGDVLSPRNSASAQNAGVVGIQAQLQPVFTAQATTKSSVIFKDIGQGVNILYYCDTGFTGSVDLEWSPNNNGTYLPLSVAAYSVQDNSCHTLTVNGYWPQLRSTLTRSGGSMSAWYSSISGPVGFASPSIGSNGPASPIGCDQSVTVGAATGGSTYANVGPINSGDTVIVCSFTVSFSGATSAGNLQLGFSVSNTCGGSPENTWIANTTSSTPQLFSVPVQQRSNSPSQQFVCITNSSGATADVALSWASVHL